MIGHILYFITLKTYRKNNNRKGKCLMLRGCPFYYAKILAI